jgi:hypothetical protein
MGVTLRLLVPSCHGPRGSSLLGTSLALFISVLLFALLWRVTRKAWKNARTLDLPFAIFSLLSYFCNPWVWEHYNVFLIFPLLLSMRVLWQARRMGMGLDKVAGGAAIISAVLWVLYFLPLGYCADLRGRFAGHPPLHLLMHAAEIATWLPIPLMIGLMSALLYWLERRNRTAAATWTDATPTTI